MTNENDGSKKKFDLEERTARFGEAVIVFAKKIPSTQVARSLIDQVVRAGTSIGANYCDADDAESPKDFRHKLGLCRKEARETKHWLGMMATAEPDQKDEARRLWQEAKEWHLIFVTILRNCK